MLKINNLFMIRLNDTNPWITSTVIAYMISRATIHSVITTNTLLKNTATVATRLLSIEGTTSRVTLTGITKWSWACTI